MSDLRCKHCTHLPIEHDDFGACLNENCTTCPGYERRSEDEAWEIVIPDEPEDP